VNVVLPPLFSSAPLLPYQAPSVPVVAWVFFFSWFNLGSYQPIFNIFRVSVWLWIWRWIYWTGL